MSLDDLRYFMKDFDIYAVSAQTLDKAFSIAADNDLEDAMQIACAIENNVDVFLTADKNLAKRYGHLLKIKLVS